MKLWIQLLFILISYPLMAVEASLQFLTAPRVQWLSTQTGSNYNTTIIPAVGNTIHGWVVCGTTVQVRWSTVLGHVYYIEESDDFYFWKTLALLVIGTGEPYTFWVNTDSVVKFYRVKIE